MNVPRQRGRFSPLGDSKFTSEGMPPSELWGVAQRDHGKPRRKRSMSAAARRRARKAAKRAGVSLKLWLSSKAVRMGVGR
jgi:hypothetical protein